MLLDRVPLPRRSAEDVARAGVVLVPERRRIFASLTVRENLIVGASGWARRRGAEQRAEELFGRFPLLAPMRDRQGGLLSGGQQQLLAIARALMGRPKVLLLDEPSIGLAPETVRAVLATIRELRDEGIAILLVEQNVRQATAMADEAFVLRKGRIEGRVEGDDELVVSSYLGARGEGVAGA
jgi:branched-chain amino acid transport system ATP-binding protein